MRAPLDSWAAASRAGRKLAGRRGRGRRGGRRPNDCLLWHVGMRSALGDRRSPGWLLCPATGSWPQLQRGHPHYQGVEAAGKVGDGVAVVAGRRGGWLAFRGGARRRGPRPRLASRACNGAGAAGLPVVTAAQAVAGRLWHVCMQTGTRRVVCQSVCVSVNPSATQTQTQTRYRYLATDCITPCLYFISSRDLPPQNSLFFDLAPTIFFAYCYARFLAFLIFYLDSVLIADNL